MSGSPATASAVTFTWRCVDGPVVRQNPIAGTGLMQRRLRERIPHADGPCRTPSARSAGVPRTPSGRARKPGAPAATLRAETPHQASNAPQAGSAVLDRLGHGLAGLAHSPPLRAA